MTQHNIVGFFVLWANLRQSGALLCNLDVENLLVNSSGKHWIITLTVVTSRSNIGSGYSSNWVVGHCLWYRFSHSGPCYHNLQFFQGLQACANYTRSTGLLVDSMCLHSYPVLNSCIWGTLLATNIFLLLTDDANHERMIVKSSNSV